MKSFVFWLTTFAAFGAILATIIHPSPIEILVIWAAVNALYYYGIRGQRKGRLHSAAG